MQRPVAFEDPDLDSSTLQTLLGDWWRVPNDARVPLKFGIQNEHRCDEGDCSECLVYKPTRAEMIDFKEYADLFNSNVGTCFFVLDIHSRNDLIMYQAGRDAVYKGAQAAPVDLYLEGSDTAPWSRYM